MKKIDLSIRYYLALIASYLSLAWFLPGNKSVMNNYGLDSGQYHLLILFIILPFIGIWFAAFYGYSTVRKYAAVIKSSPEGPGFDLLARGFTVLAWSLPFTAIASILVNSIADIRPEAHAGAIILNNYIALLLPLIGYILLKRSSHYLTTSAKIAISKPTGFIIGAVISVLAIAYCYLTFQHLDLSSLTNTNNPYYLPNWLVLTTLTIPFLASWLIGLIAAFELFIYSKQSDGLLYRRALMQLAIGVLAVIVSSVVLQYLTIISPQQGFLSLNYQLILTYTIRIFSAIGYVLIAVGARRLMRIEEV